jgi:hypothetical protein
LTTIARELGKYRLDLVGLQDVRWEKGDTERAEECTFFYGQGNGDHQLGTGFFVHKRILSGIRKVENQERLKLNGTHQILAYANDVNKVGENTRLY